MAFAKLTGKSTKIMRSWLNIFNLTASIAYSLFHQILGVAFFQFARSPFQIFNNFFSRIIFSSSPNILENLVNFFCVLSKLDHLACSKLKNDSSL